MKKNYGKMTMHEKKLNKIDLNSYKNMEGNTYALIPGIHHVDTYNGTMPLAHKGANMNLEEEYNAATAGNQRIDFNNQTIRDNNTIYKRKQEELLRKSH